MPTATVITTYEEALSARPGLYVVHSGTGAYFPILGFIEAKEAKLLGDMYNSTGRLITVQVTTVPKIRANPEGGRQITIGPEFFMTALKDYNDWPIKWWREAVQNAVDADGLNIQLSSVTNEDGTVTVSCDDDGRGMDEDTLINKFLVLGATTKIGQGGQAGGFGKAKELLLLPWISWRIHTRDTLIEGSGIDYTVTKTSYRQGTRLDVRMPPDRYTDGAIALGFLQKCDLPHVRFTVNGKIADASLRGDRPIESVPGKADIYFVSADTKQSYLYVRTRGLYMFSSYIGEIPGFLIAELTAPSIEILTANRDGFRDRSVQHMIDKLGERIAKDNMSALKNKQGLIRVKYKGVGKFKAQRLASELLEQIGPYHSGSLNGREEGTIVAIVGDYASQEEDTLASLPSVAAVSAMMDQKFTGPSHLENAINQLVWEPDFYLVNDIEEFVVPEKFFPESMSPTIFKLAKTWAALCKYVMMQLNSNQRFGVGFVFSSYAAAQAITDENEEAKVESWLMLNPFKDMYAREATWRPAQDSDLKWLYAAAIHECTHIADRISYHDEAFASALTRNMAKCADGYRKIKQIASGIRMRGGIELE
jgi:hypothetical protein